MPSPASHVQCHAFTGSGNVLSGRFLLAYYRASQNKIILTHFGPISNVVEQTGAPPELLKTYRKMCVPIYIQSHNMFDTMLAHTW